MGIPGTKERNHHCLNFGGDSVQWGFPTVGIPSSGNSGYIPVKKFKTMLRLTYFDYSENFEVVDGHCVSFLSRNMAILKSRIRF